MTGRVLPRPRRRRWVWVRVLLAIAVLLAGAAVVFGWNPAGWRLPKFGWDGTEQAGWIAGIAGAVFGLGAFIVAVIDHRYTRRQAAEQARPASRASSDGVVRVGQVPRPADWFQDRATHHDLIRAARAGRSVVLTQVLSGLGGVGKTQLAARFARHLDAEGELDVLAWITAADRQALIAGYADLAHTVGLCDADTDPQVAADRLLSWLERTEKRWLIVLDNLDTPADANGLWPPDNPYGRTLVTTRRRDPILDTDNRTMITVGLFTPAEATGYLTKATGAGSPPADIAGLADDLGLLPLAVAQAAAYIRDRGIDCGIYRELLREHGLTRVLPPRDALPDGYSATVAVTWALSVQSADDHPPRGLARPLLDIAALLDPNGIPAALFAAPAITGLLTPTDTDAPDAHAITDGLRNLHRLHLITHDPATDTVRIHALVQHATRDQLNSGQLTTTALATADALLQIWPAIDRDPAYTQALFANTTALRAATGDALLSPDAHFLLFWAARSLGETGQVTAAITASEQLLDDCLRVLGPDHRNTLAARSNLAYWCGEVGDPAGAATAFEQLLEDCRRVLGPDHRNTLTARSNLARWRGAAGDPAGAATAFEQLLDDQLRVLGPDHPNTLTTRSNLAGWRGRAGDRAGAATAFEQLLEDYQRVLGPDHPDTRVARDNLAYWQERTRNG
ncbi:tetratricopeptide repeat protein [Actinoplanes sp. NPDC023801]|uniref:tetratricopeptide repeat protein n=1 Tax=Actinoplanes sp. NPDC023801 TaxID=3154595 RepID=UPI0033D7D4F3